MNSTLNDNGISLVQALAILGIEEYADRILDSNSRGELFYLYDYVEIAQHVRKSKNPDIAREKFREKFIKAVEYAEDNWDRPESVFQHIAKMVEIDL